MRVPRKRYYPEECENREEDNTRNRNAKECLMLENTGVSMQHPCDIEHIASFSQATSKNSSTDSEEPSCRRTKQDSSFQYPEMSSESDSQVEQDGFQLSTTEETSSDCLIRRQSRRSSKWIAQTKHASELRTSSASEYEVDLISEKESQLQVKLSVSRGKCLKTKHRMKYEKEHRSSKVTLVTLRASQEEEEDEEADDFEPEYEDICFAPEEVNKAPVFVPLALRSPKPNSVQIEETVEELEIFMNVPDVPVVTEVESLSHASVQPVIQMEKNVSFLTALRMSCLFVPQHIQSYVNRINDGSTEAAMTLLAMGDPMFQLKTSTEERIDMLTAQDELDVACSLETHDYSQQDTTSSQRLLSPDTSAKEFVPSEDGSNISVEDQQDADTRIGVEEYFERNAADTSSRSFTEVNSVRLTGGSLLMPEPAFGVLNSDENTIQKSPNTNILVEKLEQVQTASTTPDIPKMHYVALDQTRPAAADSSVLHDFVTGSMEPIRQADKTKRTEKEVINSCGNSGDLRPVTASLEPEKSHLEPEDCPSQSSVDGIPEPNCCPLQHDLCTISFTQNEALAQDTQKQCVSSAEEISVANNDHRCPEEEQTFILTLVEIPADSKEFHASALLAQASEPLLPAPILINSINASETSTPEEESTGSLIASAGEFVTHLNSSLETNLLHSASVGSIPNLQTTQKRSAAELEENDFRPAKRTMSTDAVEGILEDTHKGYSIKSPSVPMTASGNAFQRTEASANEVFVSESMSQLAERSQLETLETLENSASKQEGEVMSRLTSNTKAEISGQEKQKDVCESGQLEHAGSLASSSSTPLLRGGRKPLGFLSLICKKSNSESAEDTKGKRGKTPKPRVVAPKRNLKKPTLSTKEDRESCSLPSASTPLSSSSSVLYENVAADAAVTVPSNKPSEKPPPSAKDQEKEEEPTRISEYFFSDIFMEVDDSE
ncbi:BDP1 factor, partial [Upupa epops]|nr:BDP1 factor [Upupa epops]